MAKLISKSKCSFENGFVVKKSKIVSLPTAVYLQLNKLEIMMQQYEYLLKQPSYSPGPSLEGWKRKSGLKSTRPYVDLPETPITDRRLAEAMQFMKEADAVNDAMVVNEMIDNFGDLIDWCSNDKFVEGNCIRPLDLYKIGNPLKLTADEVRSILTAIITSPIELKE